MNKTYLISGAGRGIGRAIAQKLDADGHRCILVGRTIKNLEETFESLKNRQHQLIAADVRDKRSLKDAAGKLDGLKLNGIIANAGVGGENRWGENDRWHEIIDTNLTGVYNLVNTFLPNLKDVAGERHIVIMSSVLARLGVHHYQAYCASKAGLLGLMRALAVQYASKKILANAICPGWVETDMAEGIIHESSEGLKMDKDAFWEAAMKQVPLRRMSQPSEIADLVAYLLSQRSITGQAIDINCGSFMSS